MNSGDHRVEQPKFSLCMFTGVTYTFITMMAGAFLTSLILLLTDAKETTLHAYAYGIHLFAALLGGWAAGRKSGENGMLVGGSVGILYCVMIFIVAFLAFNIGLDPGSLVILLFLAATGAIGGIIGVNSNK